MMGQSVPLRAFLVQKGQQYPLQLRSMHQAWPICEDVVKVLEWMEKNRKECQLELSYFG